MYSYVYFDKKTAQIYCWEYENDRKVLNKYPAPLYFFIESNDVTSEYKTIFGKPAKKIEATKWSEYKLLVENYQNKKIPTFESDVAIETKFIIQHYNGMELKVPKFDIFFLDIEVHSEEGFPKPEEALYPIKIITIWSTKQNKFFVFAEKDFDATFLEQANETYQKFIYSDEQEMLQKFMNFIRSQHPDVLSGWNSNGFDIPYIVNRLRKLFGFELNKEGFVDYDGAAKLSPVEKIVSRTFPLSEFKKETRYDIVGINSLDYLEIFKNYTFSEQESWKLNHIAKIELNESKKEFDGSLADLYRNNWQLYVEYNIQDVRLLKKLEHKKKFFNLLFTFCYGCMVPFEHYVKTTKVLDGAFLSKLYNENIVLPDVKSKDTQDKKEDEKYVGGYVKDPTPGLHQWIVSFDATSLYPSIMMGWNISPETKVKVLPQTYVKRIMKCIADENLDDNEEIEIDHQKVTIKKLASIIKKNKFCLAGNGALYRTDKVGVIGKFVKEWFDKRKEYKKKMLKAKEEHNIEKAEEYDGLQYNYKILINSVYGYLGTPHSRLFDYDNAVAVTMTGRLITTCCIQSLNEYFRSSSWKNHQLCSNHQPVDGDVVIYGDTDSVYISFAKIMDSMGYDYRSKTFEQVKNFILFNIDKDNKDFFDSLSKEEKESMEEKSLSLINVVSHLINKRMEMLTMKYCNLPKNTIYFKREAVAPRALFLNAKKHYALFVLNSEGVELEENKRLKFVGIDVVRSSTPIFARTHLKDLIKLILLETNYEKTVKKIEDLYTTFLDASPDDIAFPSSVNNLEEYEKKYESNGGFKSTPMHIRAAILYNKFLQKNKKLQKMYEPIFSGDKIKFVYISSNHIWNDNVFGWKEKFPKEFAIQDFINRDEQFKRSILNPLEGIFEVLNWKLPNLKYHILSEEELFK